MIIENRLTTLWCSQKCYIKYYNNGWYLPSLTGRTPSNFLSPDLKCLTNLSTFYDKIRTLIIHILFAYMKYNSMFTIARHLCQIEKRSIVNEFSPRKLRPMSIESVADFSVKSLATGGNPASVFEWINSIRSLGSWDLEFLI